MTTTTSTPELQIEDLPAWMRPRRRTTDWSLLVVLVFCSLVVWPLIVRGGLPRYTDAILHEFRSLEVARLVRASVFYSRWAPGLNYAYGSPLFNYLAPLPHYLSGYHQALTEAMPTDSLKLMLILSIVAAGTGMLCFARQRWGVRAGLISTLIYLFSEPVALSLPYLAGDLPLLMALGLLPWALWSADRLWLRPDKRSFLLAVLCVWLFLLSDARMVALGSPILALSLVSRWRQRSPDALRYLVGALAAAAALTAFFWLPALAERDQVYWLPLDGGPDTLRAGPIPLGESLAPFSRPDLQQLNPAPTRGLGTAPWGMALLGGAGLAWNATQAVRQRRHIGATSTSPGKSARGVPADSVVFLTLGLVLLALSTPMFYGLWPPPTAFQVVLPYHGLLIGLFCLAAAGGQATVWLAALDQLDQRWRAPGLAMLCLIPPLLALPALYPPEWTSEIPETAITTTLEYELQGYHAATLREGLLLPLTASQVPDPAPNLSRDLEAGTLDRVNRQSFSAGPRIDAVEQGPLGGAYTLANMSEPIRVEFYLLAFPSWMAQVGNRQVEVSASAQGLVTARVPVVEDGTMLAVWLGETPVRDVAWLLTCGAGAILILALRRRWREAPGEPIGVSDDPGWTLTRRELIGLALLLAIFGGVTFWLRERPEMLLPRSAPGQVAGPMTPLPRFLPGGVDLLGYSLPESAAAPGQILEISLFWKAARPILENNQSEVVLIRVENDRPAQQPALRVAHRHPGGVPTLRWPLDRYVLDEFALQLPADLPPGEYQIQAAIGPCEVRNTHGLLPCARIAGMDSFNALGESEIGHVTIPQRIQIRAP